jgi:hypothetical protein
MLGNHRATSVACIAAALLSCGQDQRAADESNPGSFDISLPTGTFVVKGGETTTVVFSTLNAPGPVAYAVEPLPAWATLAGATLRLAPARSDAGEYDLAVRATSGEATAVATLHITVPPNGAPALRDFMVQDMTGMPFGEASSVYPVRTACLLGPTFLAAIADPEMDRIGLEVELALDPAPLRGFATHRSQLRPSFAPLSSVELTLDGAIIGRAYRAAMRAVDEWGASSPWVEFRPRGAEEPFVFTCTPFVLPPRLLAGLPCASSDAPRSADLTVRGFVSGPVQLTATGLPSWAHLDGTTLVLGPTVAGETAPPAIVSVTASADGYVTTEWYELTICGSR